MNTDKELQDEAFRAHEVFRRRHEIRVKDVNDFQQADINKKLEMIFLKLQDIELMMQLG